ncbi:MAG: citrate synthase [Spirochaetes bacterium]|nr:citrate synthase [Spirochaetota bacterium]
MSTDHHAGLEDIEVLESSICEITQERLAFRGYNIVDLAAESSFEEVAYLLWNDALPSRLELDEMTKALRSEYKLPREIIEHTNHVPREAHPMAVLRTLVSSLGLYDAEAADTSGPALRRKEIRLLAKTPLIVAAIQRHRQANSYIEPNTDLGIAANFLYCVGGAIPDSETAHVLDTALILYAEHELNASTFAARITAATQAETYSCTVSAISTLQGNLHGGANQRALEMLLAIAKPENVDEFLDRALGKKQLVMGFGHRVYKNGDPRVPILRKHCETLAQKKNQLTIFKTAVKLEETMLKRKRLHANIDYYSGLAFYLLGFSADLFTCIFAVARMAGYLAHIEEQYTQNKLIRPRGVYNGKRNLKYLAIDKR